MANPHYRLQFGDTTFTKVFVGGLAWETPTEEMRRYFEQFGEILEAVVITDKNTGKSKGYGFVSLAVGSSDIYLYTHTIYMMVIKSFFTLQLDQCGLQIILHVCEFRWR